MIEKIIEVYEENEFIKADGFDEAIIGVDDINMRLIYSVKKSIEILTKDMSYDDAVDYFYFNCKSSVIYEKMPIWCEDDFN